MDDAHDILCTVCSEKRRVNPEILEEVIILAVEIAREGREGRRIGTIFIVTPDPEEVLKRSRPLILDPLWGHPDDAKHLDDHNMRETVKELSQLDGAFVISDKGVVLSACRFLDVSSRGVKLPLGLGSRHMAAASITKVTDAVAVVVSESSVVRVFDDGEIVSEIIPELWLMSRHALHLEGPYSKSSDEHLTVVSKP